MDTQAALVKRWVLVGGITGLLASIIYPMLIFVGLSETLQISLVFSLGPLLSIAGLGLYQLLKINGRRVSLQIAVVSIVIAGTLLNIMLVIQITVRRFMTLYLEELTDVSLEETVRWIFKGVDRVQLGLDISWDIYLTLATFLFALNMLRHPRFGRIFGLIGMLLAVLLMGFNISTFPVPPGEAGLLDLGPLLGLWYTAVAIQALRSLDWVEKTLSPYFREGKNIDYSQTELEIR